VCCGAQSNRGRVLRSEQIDDETGKFVVVKSQTTIFLIRLGSVAPSWHGDSPFRNDRGKKLSMIRGPQRKAGFSNDKRHAL
jgi:hypothetical protein